MRLRLQLLRCRLLLLQSVAFQAPRTCRVGKFLALLFVATTPRLMLLGSSCMRTASCGGRTGGVLLKACFIVQCHATHPSVLRIRRAFPHTRTRRDRCSSIWDDAEFRLTFALLFYRIALFHCRAAHVRILNVLLRGMARALQIDIGQQSPPPSQQSIASHVQ